MLLEYVASMYLLKNRLHNFTASCKFQISKAHYTIDGIWQPLENVAKWCKTIAVESIAMF